MSKVDRGPTNHKTFTYNGQILPETRSIFPLDIFILLLIIILYIIVIFTGIILFGESLFIYFSALATAVSFFLLVFIGSHTYSKINTLSLQYERSNQVIRTRSDNKPKAHNDIFFRIYEVIAALSIYEASLGIISGTTSAAHVLSPLNSFLFRPQQFVLYFVFLITSIQFMVGTSQHFEIPSKPSNIAGAYALLNYLLIIGEAVSLLGMAVSVSENSFLYFAEWYIALLIVDLIWIAVYTVFNMPSYGLNLTLPHKLNQIGGMFFLRSKILNTVHSYWVGGDVAYIVFLTVPIPLLYENVPNIQSTVNFYIFILIVITIVTTYVNSKCLLSMNVVK